MTEYTDDTAAEVIRDLAFSSQEPAELEPGKVYGWLDNGQVHKIDLTGDEYREYPKHKAGTVTVRNVASFAHYYAKHSDDSSEVYADLDKGTFTAVLDAHLDAHGGGAYTARWEKHRLVLALEQTLPWVTWTAMDRQWMTQQVFAEFIEDNCRDLHPDGRVSAADLLEIAQHFQAHTKVNFTQGTRLATGATQLVYQETIEAKAGNRGDITIPGEFDLAIVPFDDCEPQVLPARFRYRRSAGDLRLGYFLNDPQRVAREAVAEVASVLAATCEIEIMQGRPA
jgi:uncharacterized protein YfdQ (DUF2303 family)